MKYLTWLADKLCSSKAASLYMLLFAIAIGVATFVENDFGTSSAQDLIFRTWWFELLLVLFGLSILVNIYRFRMIQQRKWAALTFHAAIIIILLGAGVTRYFGYEGIMHIREGSASSDFLTAETYLNFKVLYHEKTYSFAEKVYFSSLGKNKFDKQYQIGNKIIQVKLKDFIPNPVEEMTDSPDGLAMLKVVIGGMNGREEYHVKYGDQVNLSGTKINFGNPEMPGYVNISMQNDSLYFKVDRPITQMVMATQKLDTIAPGELRPLRTRSLYNMGNSNFVIAEFARSAVLNTTSKDIKVKSESIVGLKLDVEMDGQHHELMLTGRKGSEGEYKTIESAESTIGIAYGSKRIELPFSLYLKDFIMDKYPGTENPSSYTSEVTLTDPVKDVKMDKRIFMNNILDYQGYRFFQSSFDQDELGTYLSVNHDFIGTWLSYIGYILLTIGLLFVFFQPNTRFAYLTKKLKEIQNSSMLILLWISVFSAVPVMGFSNSEITQPAVLVSAEHANKLGELLVQDFKGRFEPINTLASEVVRKLSKKSELYGLSENQIYISMMLDPETWENVPIIQSGNHPEVLKILGIKAGLTSYRNFFNEEGEYKLKEFIRAAQVMNPKDHGTFEKAIIKLDEKVNIANMVFSTQLFKVFPIKGDPNNTWISPTDISNPKTPEALSIFIKEFVTTYFAELKSSSETRNWTIPDEMLTKLTTYQESISGSILPAKQKVTTEIWLNRLNIFSNLRNIYALLGLCFLFIFLYSVFNHKVNINRISKIGFYTLLGFFVMHTLGLLMRWYVSGHAPWSNGYESMIYIAWTTTLAGLIFSRTSLGGLAATCVLSTIILLVAGMSWLDPEITPLVPVLNSYWLTIHVSMEAGSYGFLLLGAVIGMLNLVLFILTTDNNKIKIKRSIEELTIISEITITGGLIMLSIGTYLGGVWANESWGRYWGWDAKETWALVSILVYAFILHMRFIPALKSVYAYNFASLFGFATVIMTYYGVNYYLSGLHSYAAGDPVPLPVEVYYTLIALIILSILSFINFRRKYKERFVI